MSSHFKSRRSKLTRSAADSQAPLLWSGLQSLEARNYMSASPMSASPMEFGSTMAIANVVGTVSQVHSLANTINEFAEIDLFAIDVLAGQKYTFDVDGDGTFDSQLRIFDSTGKQVSSNNNGKGFGEVKSFDSFATVSFKKDGRYFVGITAAGNNKYNVSTGLGAKDGKTTGGYELIVTNLTPEDSAGKSLLLSENLGALAGEMEIEEFVGKYDTLDYYRFTLDSVSQFTLSLTDLSGDVDVRVILDRNFDLKIAKTEVIGNAATKGLADEVLVGELAAGSYFIEVKRKSGDSYYSLNLTAQAGEEESFVPENDPEPSPTIDPTPEPEPDVEPAPGPVSDWFSQNLMDSGIISLSRSLFVDGSLSRGDMMQILRVAGDDDGIVDANELADLRLIVTSATTMGLTDAVRVLAAKVVNTHNANARYQGTNLGNLAAGSSEAHIDKLVDKWFLGSDRPNATIYGSTYQYRLAAGSLFVNGPALADIEQGYVGDCYLLASLGSVAMIDPSAITSMFTNNGDGTFAVCFFRNGVADYVTVDMYLPTDASGRFIFANMGNASANAGNELWVGLAEKAYAQLNEAAWIGQDGSNSYAGIEGGWMESVYEQILGRNSTSTYMPTQQALVTAFQSGKMISLGSNNTTSGGIISGHAYVVQNYNAATGTFDLYNPWAVQHATGISYAQLIANFSWMAAA